MVIIIPFPEWSLVSEKNTLENNAFKKLTVYFATQDFDFDALEKSTEYDNGLTEGSQLIRYTSVTFIICISMWIRCQKSKFKKIP